jgi:hypothetical protein
MRYLYIFGFLFIVCSCGKAERIEPKKQIDAFFSALSDSGPRGAIDKLIDNTLLKEQKGMQIETLIPQFEAALKIYGAVARIEYVDEKHFGDSFVRIRLNTFQTSGAPLFWQFMFFRGKDGWQVYVFRFNDQFDAVYKDA